MGQTEKVVVGFMAGLAVGTIVGILVAPDNGRNTRNNISQKTNQFKGGLESTVQKGVDKLNSIKESAFTLVNKYDNELTNQANQNFN